MKRYRVTCLKCNMSNFAQIFPAGPDQYVIDINTDHEKSKRIGIISGRYRKDMKFGWECVCGNTSLLARQELPEVNELVVKGSQEAIGRLVASLKRQDEEKFKMEEV